MSFSPYHWLPPRNRAVVGVIAGSFFGLLSGFGTLRMLFEREWGYAVAAAIMCAIFLRVAWDGVRLLRTPREDYPSEGSHPIE